MRRFTYKAINRAGELRSGVLQALSQSAAAAELGSRQLLPVEIRSSDPKLPVWLLEPLRFGGRLGTREVVALTQSLASLLKAGLVLDRALHLIGSTSDRPGIRELSLDLERRVRAG